MGGKDFFTNSDWGGGQRLILGQKITVFPGGVLVNFGLSLTLQKVYIFYLNVESYPKLMKNCRDDF